MRWITLLVLVVFPVCVGCDKAKNTEATFKTVGQKNDAASSERQDEIAKASRMAPANDGVPNPTHPVKAKAQPEPAEKKDKPRKIRYTAEMKIIVEKLEDAEEKLDTVRDKFDGDYEKAEVNRSA